MSNAAPEVSVIVPVHGTEPYVAQCLRSILDQDFSDFELIVVDDASPDNAMAIVEEIAAADARIRIARHNTCQGAGGARNTGTELARGRYVMFVDSDDFVARNFISCPLACARERDHDMVEFGYTRVDGAGSKTISIHIPQSSADTSSFLDHDPSVWSKIWRREFITKNSLTMPTCRRFEDLQFSAQAMSVAKSFGNSSDLLYFYRDRSGSTMNSYSASHINDYIRTLYDIRRFMKSRGVFAKNREFYKKLAAFHLRKGRIRAKHAGKPMHKFAFKAAGAVFSVLARY